LARFEGIEKVTGKVKFTADVSFPGMLYGSVLRSERPHAVIRSIDRRHALEVPGVKAIITYEDVPHTTYNPIFNAPYPKAGLLPRDKSILRREVCFVGDPVAAVAATSLEAAEDAVSKLDVDYEDLPFVLDPLEAIKPGAPRVRTELSLNIAQAWGGVGGAPMIVNTGDVVKGFEDADEIFEDTYKTQRQNQVPLEPHVAVSYWDEHGALHLWSSTQSIFVLREKLSEALEVPVSKIRVYPSYVGGSFGSKLQMSEVEPLCAMLSLKSGKPVRLSFRRDEVFVTSSRHDTIITLKTGLKKDGAITARYCKCVLNTGAYATHGPSVALVGGMYFDGAYKTPNRRWEGYAVYTNNYSPGGMRGYGGIQHGFAVESQMDEIARKMGFDPVSFRLKNSFKKGDVNPRSGWVIESCGLEEATSRAVESFGWEKPLVQSSDPNKKRGRGIAFQTIRGSGTGGKQTAEPILEHSGATVRFNEDGTFTVITAAVDVGTGGHTAYHNIAAEALGVDKEMVNLFIGDTNVAEFEGPVHASRGTYVVGSTIKIACEMLKAEVLKAGGGMLKVDPAGLEINGKAIVSRGEPSTGVKLSELGLFTRFHLNRSLAVSYSATPTGNPPPFGAAFAEVEVDLQTGLVRVLRYVGAQDVGKAIYPAGAKGQMEGAIFQGLGLALMEEVKTDARGRVMNANLTDYKVPTFADMPRNESILVETYDPSGVGAKSVSEASLHPVIPVIANAVRDAIGVRFKALPISPESVLAALREGKQEYP